MSEATHSANFWKMSLFHYGGDFSQNKSPTPKFHFHWKCLFGKREKKAEMFLRKIIFKMFILFLSLSLSLSASVSRIYFCSLIFYFFLWLSLTTFLSMFLYFFISSLFLYLWSSFIFLSVYIYFFVSFSLTLFYVSLFLYFPQSGHALFLHRKLETF